jgi:hypothetical protein
MLPGCGGSTASSEDGLTKAQVALESALNGWVRNEPLERFAATDPDWRAGYRLLSFLTADAKYVDQRTDQVRCRVSLALIDPKGQKLDKEATYLVELGDTITVRRETK